MGYEPITGPEFILKLDNEEEVVMKLEMEDYIDFEEDKAYEIDPKEAFIRLACCHCGLVHDIFLEVRDLDTLRFTLQVNEEETEKARKSFKVLSGGEI